MARLTMWLKRYESWTRPVSGASRRRSRRSRKSLPLSTDVEMMSLLQSDESETTRSEFFVNSWTSLSQNDVVCGLTVTDSRLVAPFS